MCLSNIVRNDFEEKSGIFYDHIYDSNIHLPTLKKLDILRNLSLF